MKFIIASTMFCSCLLALIALTAHAQKKSDYIITAKGDSLPCTVSIPFFNGVLPKYKTNDMDKAVKVDPIEVKEYSTKNGKYIYASAYKSGNKRPEFMEVIEKGKIYLYEVINTYQSYTASTPTYSSSIQNWYISKGDNKAKSLKTSSFFFFDKSRQERKDDFGEMIKDNQAVYDKYITGKKFTFKELRKLIHLYNTGETLPDNNDD